MSTTSKKTGKKNWAMAAELVRENQRLLVEEERRAKPATIGDIEDMIKPQTK